MLHADHQCGIQQKGVVGSALGAFFVAAFLGLLTLPATADDRCAPFKATEPVTIKAVTDGDSVRLRDGRKVRLTGINAPEVRHGNRPAQPWAIEAKQALTDFLGKRALLITDTKTTDKYGRTLAHLYNLDGQSAEAHLLSKGLAWHVAIPPNLALADCFAAAEQQAQQQQLALWGTKGIEPVLSLAVNDGGFQRVRGTLTHIHFGKNAWWLNLGPQLAAVIYPQHQHRFDRKTLVKLQGKTVEIRGWVYPSRSKKYQPWRVKLETPYGIKEGRKKKGVGVKLTPTLFTTNKLSTD